MDWPSPKSHLDEGGIAGPTAVTILFGTRIAVDAPGDRFVAMTPPGCFKQAADGVKLPLRICSDIIAIWRREEDDRGIRSLMVHSASWMALVDAGEEVGEREGGRGGRR